MGLSSILSSSTFGLRSVQTSLQWRSDNISNASNPEYSRRDPTTTNVISHFTSSDVKRAVNNNLQLQMMDANSNSENTKAQLDFFKRISDVLGTGQSKPVLTDALDQFVAAWKSFESEPASTFSESEVIRTGAQLGDQMRSVYASTRRIETELRSDMGTTISDLNTKLTELDAVNKRIGAEPLADKLDPQLFDNRDRLVKEISGYVGVTTLERADGTIALYTKSGAALVDHAAAQFQWNDPVGANGYITISGAVPVPAFPGSNGLFSGGKIGGMLDVLNPNTASTNPAVGALAKLRNQLDSLANSLAGDGVLPANGAASFGGAYAAASADRSTDLLGTPNPALGAGAMVSFFTIDNSANPPPQSAAESFSINANLLNGTSSVKRQSATAIVAELTSATRSMNTGGINIANRTYNGLSTAMAQVHTNSQSTLSATSTQQTATFNTLENRYISVVGVNMDFETAQLSVLQNAYAANARVVNTVQQMFDTLLQMSR